MTAAAAAAALTAAVVSAVGLALLIPVLRRALVVDVPVERSLHATPVPRGGGIAVVFAVLVGLVVFVLIAYDDVAPSGRTTTILFLLLLFAAVLAFASIGLWDDLVGASPTVRLLLQIFMAAVLGVALLTAAGRSWIWLPVLVFGTVALVNITNFMDGTNGLLGFHALVTAGWFAFAAHTAAVTSAVALALVVAGAVVGFLPFNVPTARVFLGDVGSYALGATWAVLAVWLLLWGVRIEVIAAPLAVFLADTAYTLWLRLRAGHRWFQPHKLHVYQRLVAAGWSHVASSALVAGVALACSALAVPALLGAGTTVRLVCVGAMALVCALYLRMPVWVGAPEPWQQAKVGRLP